MRTVLLDFSSISETNQRETLALLQDSEVSSLILLGRRTEQDLVSRITDAKLNRVIKAVLKRLRDRNRLLTCADIKGSEGCEVETFHCPIENANANIVVGNDITAQTGTSFNLDNYFTNGMREVMTVYDYSMLARDSRESWRNRIFAPLFTAVRKVTFVDYYAGREARDFEPTLTWLNSQVQQFSVHRVQVTLYTSIDGDSSAIRALCSRFGWTLQLRRYNANSDESLPHDRYIITDRLAVQIGRGLNLCTDQVSAIRDCAIYICADGASIINKAHRAPTPGRA